MFKIACASLLVFLLCGCGGGTGGATTTQVLPLQSAVAGPVVFIGDSITQFWQDGAPPTYPTAVPTLDERLPGVVDVGVSGQTTAQMLARFQTDVLAQHPSVVVILGGSTDLRVTPDATIDSISAMAEQAAAAGAEVILGTVPPSALWTASTFLTQEQTLPAIQQWNSQLKTLAAAYGYKVADYYAVMVNPDGTENTSLFIADAIHPDSAGYAVMWSVVNVCIGESN